MKAVELISRDNLTYEERTLAKNTEARKETVAIYNNLRFIEIAKIIIADNEPDDKITKYTELSIDQIQKLRSEIKL